MNVEQNIALFQEQIMCGYTVYTWQFDPDIRLLNTNCPHSGIFDEALTLFDCKATLAEQAKASSQPMILSSPIGLVWAAAFQKSEDELQRVYVLGPILTTENDVRAMDRALREYASKKEISIAWRSRMMDVLKDVPVLQVNILYQYALMLHYCVTGERLRVSDLKYQDVQPIKADSMPTKDRHQVWMAEQALLRSVREGDLNFRSAFDNASAVSTGVTMPDVNSLQRAKYSTIVFISLCTRAAIEGGLSPEQAYSLGDTYIQSVENCTAITEVSSYSYTMYQDFVERVYKCRVDPKVSPQIRAACEYIELHTETPLSVSELAKRFGYAEYYLTRKFTSEMGISINDYIKTTRIERAKQLLVTTDLSIQEIAEKLQFCTRSYFGKVFSQIVGCTPVKYRQQQKRM